MIGNDIVDLRQARGESNWRRKGFLDKLFSPHEQQLIAESVNPDTLVWTLWSMKESAYKLIVRETGQRFFAPKKLICQINDTCSSASAGSVFYHKTYTTRSIIARNYVASIAFWESAEVSEMTSFLNKMSSLTPPPTPQNWITNEVITFAQTDYPYQHRQLREAIRAYYASHFSVPEVCVQVITNESGVPTLLVRYSPAVLVRMPISLSHHGHYGAFASF